MSESPSVDDPARDAKSPPVKGSRFTRFLLTEPLVHFVICAAILFFVSRHFGKPEIVVSPEVRNGLRQDFVSRAGRPPTSAELDKLVNEYIDDEVLYREALRQGLERDSRVRTLLVQTMRTTLRPVLPDPTDADLEALRRENPEAFRLPTRLSFEHVSFVEEKDIPLDLPDRLRAGGSAPGGGTLTKLPNPFPLSEPSRVEAMLGADFTGALWTCQGSEWTGPLRSRRGVHFVRIVARDKPRDVPLAEIRPKLVALWIARREGAEVSAKAAELRQGYRVVLPPADSPAR
jgi:hypothetical protein